jgi:succinate dehydrogenase / fumarate reductase, cytochrome b subunit
MSSIPAHASSAKSGGMTQYHFLLRRLHSLTGVLFGGFVMFHLTVNATLIEGSRHDGSTDVFQGLVNYIHSIPFMTAVSIAGIFLPIIFHTLYGFYIIYTGLWNVGSYGYTRNYLYIFQRVTAVVLVFFLLFHTVSFKGMLGSALPDALKFNAEAGAASVSAHLSYAWWVWAVVYPLGILAAAFHTANGFYAAGVTWGLTISAQAQKRWGLLCTAICLGLFMLGMTALTAGILNAGNKQAGAPTTQAVVQLD